ncbi:hypothetical protein ES711_10480 [Gelidibacter salicanalis]|uniref:Uncharacterized protein n=1 Tax=Gelidibacter salicanalis TaxID=291193 RepID=A0A5C7AJ48_9FLAO|nr:hypothetical protein [Gelidibacter salicanalis]TXE07849.1 hypothetical protein ES711_10480 [Gelidibacter salicanalis]
MKPNIELNIDQLVLEGFSRNEALAISQSIQTELHQMIKNGNLENTFTEDFNQRNMHVNAISTSSNSRPESVGRQIAQSIFNGLSTNNLNNG